MKAQIVSKAAATVSTFGLVYFSGTGSGILVTLCVAACILGMISFVDRYRLLD